MSVQLKGQGASVSGNHERDIYSTRAYFDNKNYNNFSKETHMLMYLNKYSVESNYPRVLEN